MSGLEPLMLLAAAGQAAQLAGSFVTAQGTLAAGEAANAATRFESEQLKVQALEERAAAQQEAIQDRRNKELALSALQARGAASGFSASDETILDLAGDIEKQGELQAGLRQFGGARRQRGLLAQAAARRAEGRAALTGARYSAVGTILGGFGSAMKTYQPQGGSSGGRYG